MRNNYEFHCKLIDNLFIITAINTTHCELLNHVDKPLQPPSPPPPPSKYIYIYTDMIIM